MGCGHCGGNCDTCEEPKKDGEGAEEETQEEAKPEAKPEDDK